MSISFSGSSLEALLMAWAGTTFALSSLPIWVQPVAAALAVKPQFEPQE